MPTATMEGKVALAAIHILVPIRRRVGDKSHWKMPYIGNWITSEYDDKAWDFGVPYFQLKPKWGVARKSGSTGVTGLVSLVESTVRRWAHSAIKGTGGLQAKWVNWPYLKSTFANGSDSNLWLKYIETLWNYHIWGNNLITIHQPAIILWLCFHRVPVGYEYRVFDSYRVQFGRDFSRPLLCKDLKPVRPHQYHTLTGMNAKFLGCSALSLHGRNDIKHLRSQITNQASSKWATSAICAHTPW